MTDPFLEKRCFLRHPINVPILFLQDKKKAQNELVESKDISQGGLSFLSTERLTKGVPLKITIPVKNKRFKLKAHVVYSKKDEGTGFFRTGVSFIDYSSAFQAKLAEEMLEILEYQKKISYEEGHEVSEEEAAKKWISRFSKFFPKIVQK